MTLAPVRVALDEVLDVVASIMRAHAGSTPLKLVIVVEPDVPA